MNNPTQKNKFKLLTTTLAIIAILFLVTIISFPNDNDNNNLVGRVISETYPEYAQQETFTINEEEYIFENENDSKTIIINITDDAIYYLGYISNNEENWTPFNITPGEAQQGYWIANTTTANINITANQLANPNTSENYIVIYTCSENEGTWDCHDGWQIKQFNTSINTTENTTNTTNTTTPFCGDGTCDSGENCSTCSNDCGTCPTNTSTPNIPEGFIAHYRFEENADDWTGNHDGQLENGASISTDSERGKVLSLDGEDDQVNLGSTNDLDLWQNLTISSWIYSKEDAENKKIYTRRNTLTFWLVNGNGIYFQQGGSPGWGDIHTNSGITRNNWHHVVITHNSNNDAEIYIDGTLKETGTLVLESDTSSTAYIGSLGNSGYFNGSIDDVMIWDRNLNATEIQNLYNAQKDVVLNCSENETRACKIFKGTGNQTRECNQGIYGDWLTCTVVSCNSGYLISGNECILDFNPPTTGNFSVGIAKVEITPPIGQPLGGYGNYDGCISIHDPLYARVVVMQEEGVFVAFVSLDLLMFSSNNVINQAKQTYGIDHVILGVTHTHGGPVPMGMTTWSNYDVNPEERMDFDAFPDDPWYAQTEYKVVTAIGEAMSNMFPASISAGKGMLEDSAYLAHNRRYVAEDGTVTMWWSNTQRLPTSPLDHTVGVVRIHDNSGDTRAMMVNFAAHPVHTGSSSDIVTADYPGAMSKYIENELGPDSVALFFNGAAGDIDPYFTGYSGTTAFNNIEWAGEDLALEALSVVTQTTNGSSIKVNPVTFNFSERWNPSKPEEAGLTTIVIHDSIAFVTLVGEVFIQHQINLYNESPLPNTFLYGYSYSGLGGRYLMYLPTIQAANEGGYGASYMTYLEIGATEQMMDEAISFINQSIET